MATDRTDIRNRIIERLDQLDDKTLQQLDALLAEDGFGLWPASGPGPLSQRVDAKADEPGLLSRRQLLAGLVAGGAALGSTNLATAWYTRAQGEAAGWEVGANAAQVQMMAETGRTLQGMQAEIDALRGLVAHYEALESVSLERAVAQSIERFESSVAGLPDLTRVLIEGIDSVRGVLDRFEATLPAIRKGMAHVDDTLDSLDQRLEALRHGLADIMERAAPAADNLGGFFDAVLDLLPFGLGERIEMVLLRLRQVVEAVPAAMAAVREHLLGPLRSTWFANADDGDVQVGLLTPIRNRVLDPAQQLLAELEELVDSSRREVAEPVQHALAEREAVRQALVEYKRRHGLT